jgi:hypothetical protein
VGYQLELNMSFSEEFNSWIDAAFASEVPKTLVAYSFNLFELGPQEAKYGIELIGADEFDTDNSDWACNEVWEADPSSMLIPRTFANGTWEECLDDVRALLTNILSKSSATATKLKEAIAVAIGFVDGDLELIWKR